jgi:hypothetical protein
LIVSVVEAVTLPCAAVIVAVPAATPVAKPVEEIVAVPLALDAHVTDDVTSCVVPSLKVAMAWNCTVAPAASDGFDGVTAIDATVAALTVNVVDAVTLPLVAPIVVVPAPTADARPPLVIVATAGTDDVHVTLEVMLRTEPSSYVPCATNCRVVPTAPEAPAGLIEIVCSFTGAAITT